jgi:hypothetical protein
MVTRLSKLASSGQVWWGAVPSVNRCFSEGSALADELEKVIFKGQKKDGGYPSFLMLTSCCFKLWLKAPKSMSHQRFLALKGSH